MATRYKSVEGELELRCRDDVQGMDLPAHRQRAQEQGELPSEYQNWDRDARVRKLFREKFLRLRPSIKQQAGEWECPGCVNL